MENVKYGLLNQTQEILNCLNFNTGVLDSNQIFLINSAVGNYCGEAVFCDNVQHGALSRITSTVNDSNTLCPNFWDKYSEIKVEMVTLDSFLEKHPDVHPSFVKIDVEGAGAMVLKGAISMLHQYKPMFNCEFHSLDEEREMNKLLEDADYKGIIFHSDGSMSLCCPGNSGGNYIHASDPRISHLNLRME